MRLIGCFYCALVIVILSNVVLCNLFEDYDMWNADFKNTLFDLYNETVSHKILLQMRTQHAYNSGQKEKEKEIVFVPAYPNSGSTWFANLNFYATGIFSESVYRKEGPIFRTNRGTYAHSCGADEMMKEKDVEIFEKCLKKLDFLVNNGEGMGNETVFVKTHHVTLPKLASKAVKIIRNPLDNYLAIYRYKANGGHGFENKGSEMMNLGDFIKHYIYWHCRSVQFIAGMAIPLKIIRYEDLLKDTNHVLKEIYVFSSVLNPDIDRAVAGDPPSMNHSFNYTNANLNIKFIKLLRKQLQYIKTTRTCRDYNALSPFKNKLNNRI